MVWAVEIFKIEVLRRIEKAVLNWFVSKNRAISLVI